MDPLTLSPRKFRLTVVIVLLHLLIRVTSVMVVVLILLASDLMMHELVKGLIARAMLDLNVRIRRACRVSWVVPVAGSVTVLLQEPARRDRALLRMVLRVRTVMCIRPTLGRRVASRMFVARARNCSTTDPGPRVLNLLCTTCV